MEQINPYEGLSDAARELCIKRMMRTLSRKPTKKVTRLYVKSLTGEPETEEQLRARAKSVAEKVIERAHLQSDSSGPIVLRARKARVSPTARREEQRHPLKYCRRAVRYQPHISAGVPRASRDMVETHKLRMALIEAQGDLCAICGHPMHGKASLDHVIPHAMLKRHGDGNYVATHPECNGDKTNDVPTGCEMVWLLNVNARLGLKPDTY